MDLSDAQTAKPDLVALRQASLTPAPQVVAQLVETLGPRLVAYIAGVKDSRTLVNWQDKGEVPYIPARRLQTVLAAVLTLRQHTTDPQELAAWFTWMTDALDDASPAGYLRGAEDDEAVEIRSRAVLAAARSYLME